MRRCRWTVSGILAGIVVSGLTACGGADESSPHTSAVSGRTVITPGLGVIGPVTVTANTLQGATVELTAGRVLDIDTGDLPVTSYRGEVADPRVATFTPGRDEGGAQFDPGVTAVAPGTTEVTMTGVNGGIGSLRFTVVVTAARQSS
ncbi:MAG: hypothetical protein QM809_10600 [Gordonia sp. (in: high G+C Gram-positive bacteria)]|uniref:hypothetical protein n=1 Tax=Gordonia sp. (in: high G+C Gram-positive bacteria) TaxID=84139 RepID=UPI0039E62E5B